MSKYYNISEMEMAGFLRADKGWNKQIAGKEFVFEFPLKNTVPGVVIKVYSGIRADDGDSRKCGGDAIRVCAVDTRVQPNRGYIGNIPRVHRVEGWQANLKARIEKVIEQSKARAGVKH